MKKCAILGASGHGKVVAEIAEMNGYRDVVFFDDRWPSLTSLERWVVVGNTDTLCQVAREFDLTVVAIGNNQVRLQKQQQLSKSGAVFSVLSHPTAVVSTYSSVAEGTVIMANAVLSSYCRVGMSCIINTGATVDHDCHLGDGVHISPGVNLAGGVIVGESSWVGIGSQVNQLIVIGRDAMVGSGSTVINNIPDNETVVGTPAISITQKHS